MTRRDANAYLFDMKEACDLIAKFAHGKTLDDYRHDDMLRSAIERQLMIIGEAMTQLLKLDDKYESQITDAKRIITFRNILVHSYEIIDEGIVWDIVTTKLPVLRKQVDQ